MPLCSVRVSPRVSGWSPRLVDCAQDLCVCPSKQYIDIYFVVNRSCCILNVHIHARARVLNRTTPNTASSRDFTIYMHTCYKIYCTIYKPHSRPALSTLCGDVVQHHTAAAAAKDRTDRRSLSPSVSTAVAACRRAAENPHSHKRNSRVQTPHNGGITFFITGRVCVSGANEQHTHTNTRTN